ncbi:MAG TPA: outer membrane beta-barrel protein [Methylomirabilota bacterium]|jgi:opacity protein-like surface antigen|nr:outer membrane beta-barrel protein [Methylomirabilota bacterium]
MRRLAALSIFVAIALLPSLASAENFYVILRGGPGFTPDVEIGPAGREDPVDFGTGFTGGAAAGYAFPFGLRAEGEFGFIYAPVQRDGATETDGSFRNYLLMANAYYDFKFFGPIKPYVGFGLGAARVHEDWNAFSERTGRFFDVDETRTEFAYQGRAGIGYEVNKWLDLSLGYRYVHIDGGSETANAFPLRYNSFINHGLELGAAFKF